MSMGFHPHGKLSQIPAEQRLNVFALVIYIPDPLGIFLDDLRRQLVPDCNPHAHVSVLPPRPLAVDWQVAGQQVRECAANWAAFEIVLQRLRIFPVTNVIYLELGQGAAEMCSIHAAMNSQALEFEEPFKYHPHITLAQEIPPAEVADVNRLAQQLWDAYTGPRSFRAERTAFVQSTLGNCWIDLAEFSLGAVAV
jgi:2'-5' RNA ligase